MSDAPEPSDGIPEIEIVEIQEVVPQKRNRPTVGLRDLGRRKGSDLDVCVHERVILGVSAHLSTDTTQELGGLLVGNICLEERQHWLDVSDFVPAVHTEAGGAHLKFTIETWAALDRELEARYPAGEKVSVGWYHSHPNLGVFFSSADEGVHQQFRSWWQVAAVVDPCTGDIAFFREMEDGVHRLPGVAVYGDGEVRERIPLSYDMGRRGVPEDRPVGLPRRPEDVDAMRGSPEFTPRRPRRRPRRLWILLVLAALVSLGFLLAGILTHAPEPPSPHVRAGRISTWVDKLRSVDPALGGKAGAWLERLKNPPAAVGLAKEVEAVEADVRGEVAQYFQRVEKALEAWDDLFKNAGDSRPADAAKTEVTRSWEELERRLPRSSGVELDEDLLGAKLVKKYGDLKEWKDRVRVRIMSPDPARLVGKGPLVVKGEVEGALESDKVTANGTGAVVAWGKFEATLGLEGDGHFLVRVEVRSGAGNAAQDATYLVDKTPPKVLFDETEEQPARTESADYLLHGRVSDAHPKDLTESGKKVRMEEGTGEFTYRVTFLRPETRTLRFRAVDAAGHSSEDATFQVKYDPPWAEPLGRAREAIARREFRVADAAYKEAVAAHVPVGELPAREAALLDEWRRPATLRVDQPREGAVVTTADPVEVTGVLTTGRETEQVFVNGRSVSRVEGAFHTSVPTEGLTELTIVVEAHDGTEVRDKVTRRVRVEVPVVRDEAGSEGRVLSSEQTDFAKSLSIPPELETPWKGRFLLLPPPELKKGEKFDSVLYLQADEMTNQQYKALVSTHPIVPGTSELPVTGLSFEDVKKILTILKQLTGTSAPTWRGEYGLPSSAQWERAASSADGKLSSADANLALENDSPRIAAVGRFPPNRMGFRDLIGNVWEWTADPAPPNVAPGSYIVRGGAWTSGQDVVAGEFRSARAAAARDPDLGFRLVVVVKVEDVRRKPAVVKEPAPPAGVGVPGAADGPKPPAGTPDPHGNPKPGK